MEIHLNPLHQRPFTEKLAFTCAFQKGFWVGLSKVPFDTKLIDDAWAEYLEDLK